MLNGPPCINKVLPTLPSIRRFIHVGPPRTIRECFQETGRAGHDGKPASATLYYNNRDIAKNREGMTDDIRNLCQLQTACLRKFLLKCLDAGEPGRKVVGLFCCTYYKQTVIALIASKIYLLKYITKESGHNKCT